MDIYTDGHLDGFNGIGGVFPDTGYSAIQKDGKKILINYFKKSLTNNEAELLAIFHACMIAKKSDTILSDSQIAIRIATSGRSDTDRFQLIAIAIKYLIDKKHLSVKWISRENNPIT